MPKLTVPDRHKPGIAAIQELQEADVLKIKEAMKQGATITASSLISAISSTDVPQSKQLGETIAALYRVKSARDWTGDEFADAICTAMGAVGSERDKLRKNLLTLLAIDEFELRAKAVDLQTESERYFCHGRILTDLRPVFGSDISEGPRAMVIVHLLQIGFLQAGVDGHREFYVSLDAEDLRELRKIIERAEDKAKSLKSAIPNYRYLAKS